MAKKSLVQREHKRKKLEGDGSNREVGYWIFSKILSVVYFNKNVREFYLRFKFDKNR